MRKILLFYIVFSYTCYSQQVKQNSIKSFNDIVYFSDRCGNQDKFENLIRLAENHIKLNPNDSLRLELIKIKIDFYQRNFQYNKTENLIKGLLESKSQYFKNIGYSRKALLFLNTGNTKFAFEYFLKAYSYAKIKNDLKETAIIFTGLGNFYSIEQKNEKAITYYEKAYNLLPEDNFIAEKSLLLNNLTSTYVTLNNIEKSRYYHNQQKELMIKNPENELIKFHFHFNNANFYAKTNKKSSKKSLKIVKKISFDSKNSYRKGLYYQTNAQINYHEKNLHETIKSIDSSLFYFKKWSSDLYVLNALDIKFNVLKEMEDFKKAFEVLEEYKKLKSKTDNLHVDAYIQEAELKYNDLNQKLAITKLKLNNEKYEKQKKNFAYAFIIFTIIIIFVTIILFQNNKEINFQNNIINSKNQTNTFLTILRTEDRERKRISNELHDIVGAKMAVLKLMMEHNFNEHPTNKAHYNKTSFFVDKIIDEIRQISHNLMPQNIKNAGLNTSISELINDINNQTKIHIDYFSSGIEEIEDEYYALFIYRLVQEFTGNILKHSGATDCILNIFKKKNTIYLTIEDNGIGFETDKEFKGQGIKEIQNYVKNVNGKFEIESSPNNGTIINISFNLTNTTNTHGKNRPTR